MRSCFILLLLAAAFSVDAGYDPNEHQWMLFPGGDGQPHFALLAGTVYEDRSITSSVDQVFFYIYTSKNPELPQQITKNNLADVPFSAKKSTKVIVHGYASTIKAPWVMAMKNALLDNVDCQVIVVDWSVLTRPPLYNYAAEIYAPQAGTALAELLAALVTQRGARLEDMHLIGHSLGAHLAGFAGAQVQNQLQTNISRITALDPALPLFPATARLSRSHAAFVDVIHTGGGWLGISEPIGHADFYPNGGKQGSQPGCNEDPSGCCSHTRAVRYFTESISSDNFRAQKCASFVAFSNNVCAGEPGISMGLNAPPTASGNFYLVTSAQSPYALG